VTIKLICQQNDESTTYAMNLSIYLQLDVSNFIENKVNLSIYLQLGISNFIENKMNVHANVV